MKPNYKRKERRGQDRRLYAPASGQLKPLSSASDPVFASRMFGEGIAMHFSDDTIVSPCTGTLTMVSNTKHCLGLENEQGDMILIHIGKDAAQFRGKGFDVVATEGTKVKPGVPLLRIDRRFFENQNADLTLCMTITNQNRGLYRILEGDQIVAGKSVVMERKQ